MAEPKPIAKVVAILGSTQVVINRGSDDGVKVGARYVVYSLGSEVFDPDTKESLGQIELVKGKGEVIHTQARMATLETYEFDRGTKVVTQQSWGSFSGYPFGPNVTETQDTRKTFQGVQEGDSARQIKD